jgi:ABC-type spermidine/putrescine transport system permease subunit II
MRLFVKKFYLALMLLFLYTPIAVLIVQSFNAGKAAPSGRVFASVVRGAVPRPGESCGLCT